jgi:hypothetical protein
MPTVFVVLLYTNIGEEARTEADYEKAEQLGLPEKL